MGFTTIELKTNFLATARDGALRCSARLVHGGGRTQVWDATVRREDDERVIALFRCTQFLLPADDARTERQRSSNARGREVTRTMNAPRLAEPAAALRRKREATVREHMESENRHDFDTTMGDVRPPALRDHRDRRRARRRGGGGALLRGDARGVPRPAQRADRAAPRRRRGDRRVRPARARTWGRCRGLPPTGREFTCRMVALFLFEEDRLVCERVYFDSATILRQLGIAHDPLTLKGRVATLAEPPAHDRPRRGAVGHRPLAGARQLFAHVRLDIRTMGPLLLPQWIRTPDGPRKATAPVGAGGILRRPRC